MAAIWLLRVDLLFVALFLVFISWGDILLRIISHRYLLVLTVLIFLALILQHQKPNLVAAGTVLLVGFFLFSAGVIGGGDVKLLTILSLAIDEHELANFLVAMTFCGALVVLAGLLFFENQLVKTVCLMLYQFHWLFCLHILFSLCFVNSLGQHK